CNTTSAVSSMVLSAVWRCILRTSIKSSRGPMIIGHNFLGPKMSKRVSKKKSGLTQASTPNLTQNVEIGIRPPALAATPPLFLSRHETKKTPADMRAGATGLSIDPGHQWACVDDAPSSPPYTFCNGVGFGRFWWMQCWCSCAHSASAHRKSRCAPPASYPAPAANDIFQLRRIRGLPAQSDHPPEKSAYTPSRLLPLSLV
ncbi:hypothetical protein B0H14DRAFT_2955493, partial [Mycena olivaceomarginata]